MECQDQKEAAWFLIGQKNAGFHQCRRMILKNERFKDMANDVDGSGAKPCSTVWVKGYAFVPVEIRLPLHGEPMTDEEAMQSADEFFRRIPSSLKGYIVPSSEDYSAVFDFKASAVDR
jgi:hypothetical protein